jgi:Flp pilus assembly protein TadG
MNTSLQPVDPVLQQSELCRPWFRVRRSMQAFGSETGAVAIETALSFMLMMTMVLGIIEFSVMAYTYSVLGDAARHGVRYATIHGTASSNCSGPSTGCADSGAANVISDVTTYANTFARNISGMQVQVTYPDAGGSTAPSRVTVAITYTYQPMFHVIGTSPAFHVSSQGRILY